MHMRWFTNKKRKRNDCIEAALDGSLLYNLFLRHRNFWYPLMKYDIMKRTDAINFFTQHTASEVLYERKSFTYTGIYQNHSSLSRKSQLRARPGHVPGSGTADWPFKDPVGPAADCRRPFHALCQGFHLLWREPWSFPGNAPPWNGKLPAGSWAFKDRKASRSEERRVGKEC